MLPFKKLMVLEVYERMWRKKAKQRLRNQYARNGRHASNGFVYVEVA